MTGSDWSSPTSPTQVPRFAPGAQCMALYKRMLLSRAPENGSFSPRGPGQPPSPLFPHLDHLTLAAGLEALWHQPYKY